jgi:hypothetical protein
MEGVTRRGKQGSEYAVVQFTNGWSAQQEVYLIDTQPIKGRPETMAWVSLSYIIILY